jgi:alanine-glyoxylate transaminase/serine-glyoxylate transaminase/serine-pyruvate transaminase
VIHERHLFGPGPSNPHPEATVALALPLLGLAALEEAI